MMADFTDVDLPLPAESPARAEHPGEAQPGAEGADLQEGAAADAVAVALTRPPQGQHVRYPP